MGESESEEHESRKSEGRTGFCSGSPLTSIWLKRGHGIMSTNKICRGAGTPFKRVRSR